MEDHDTHIQHLLDTGHCCRCEAPLSDSRQLYTHPLPRAATWLVPPKGGQAVRAFAVLCRACNDTKNCYPEQFGDQQITHAVQLDGRRLIYHPVGSLPELPLERTYRIARDGRGHEFIECARCGMRSYNRHDIAEGYCGYCHRFHEP